MSLVWLNALISSLHVCLGITMSTHLLMLEVVRSAIPDARRRIDSPHFEQKESELRERCRKAGVEYEGPQENEDCLLSSVDREEKERAQEITHNRRQKLDNRINREYKRRRMIDDNGRKATVCEPCDGDPNKRQQHVCAVCDTVRIGSKKLTSMSKEELLSQETRIGLGAFKEHYGIELHPDLVSQYERKGLEGLLLSKRARELDDGSVEVCESCRNSLRRSQESPPK